MRPGNGPGVITADGCAVEVYRRLRPMGEAEISRPAGARRTRRAGRADRRARDADILSATVRYWSVDDLWTHPFTARRIDDKALHRELRDAGLSFEQWCSDDRSWFAARRTG